jgi:hypothetical protein
MRMPSDAMSMPSDAVSMPSDAIRHNQTHRQLERGHQ